MWKSKIILAVLGLSLALAGCGSADNHKPSQTSDGNTNKQSSQHTSTNTTGGSETAGSSTNQNAGSSQSMDSGTTNSNSPVPSGNNSAPQSNTLHLGTVTAVRLADFNTGWVGGNGWIAKTISGGKNWAMVYQGNGTVQQLFALNHSDVWAVLNNNASNSKLLKSSDGGLHWVVIGTTPTNAFLHFTSKTTGLSGNYLSQDGGKTWHALPIPTNTVGSVYFHDIKNGWAVTQNNHLVEVKTTKDGGVSWETVMSKSLESPITDATIRSAGTNDAWIELIGDTGMTQTSYSFFHTTDGGNSWQTVIANSTAGGGPAPGFSQDYNKGPFNNGTKPGPLYVVNAQVAFMGGACPACDKQNSIGWTKDGGKTWVNTNARFEGDGDAYLAIADANRGWWITTESEKQSVMYTTSDGGYTWKQVHVFQ